MNETQPEPMRDPLPQVAAERTPDLLAFEQCMKALEALPPEAQFRVIQATCILLDLDRKAGL